MADLKKKRKLAFGGFTLVELIVVITILAILATIGFLSLSGYSQDAKDATTKANVRSVQTSISAESALTGNSPRYYVVHDANAALTGAFAYVDATQTALTGGAWDASGTNYSAGNPDWTKLKLNPEKFRISSITVKRFSPVFGTAFSAYDAKAITIGAADINLPPSVSGRNRTSSFFQVAGVTPTTGVVTVSGNFPAPTEAQIAAGATAGLIKAPSGTGALIDGSSSVKTNEGALPQGPTTYPGCNAQDIYLTGSNQYWAACNVGATNVFNGYVANANDSPVATDVTGGMFFQWGKNIAWDFSSGTTGNNNCTWNRDAQTCGSFGPASSWSTTVSDTTSGGADRWSDWSANEKRGPCAIGYHVPSALEWDAAISATASNRNTLVSILKLPMAGARKVASGSHTGAGPNGTYWSSSPTTAYSKAVYINTTAINNSGNTDRAMGASVRCMRD